VKLLFHNDPPELTRQLAPIGRDLPAPGRSVVIQNNAQAGLLHLFANDRWQTASNNSGGVQLRITRLAKPERDVPVWTLQTCGGWSRRRAEVGSSSGAVEGLPAQLKVRRQP